MLTFPIPIDIVIAEALGGDSQGDQKVTLIFFLGGVTFAEIAALRFLSQQEDGELPQTQQWVVNNWRQRVW